ncbi:MAG: cell division protein FtsZ [Schleiferiaceae bacterium]|nr:cell division protein FtsZ [Schleiferiaceae bacterium]
MTDESNLKDDLQFDLPKNQSSVIKVIGVGGGGSNAVNYMFQQGIQHVDFVVSNTDSQALENSPVPKKVQLGVTLTEGLGAGANPEVGEQAAKESLDEIHELLRTNTKMVFITAGMGGGTGTGAAPIIAKAAKDMGILTVGIVTIPFIFEGTPRRKQAEKGVDTLRENVDSLVVINNNKLREVYGNLGFKAGFAKADEVLATAARGIAEVITHHYTANIDLRDAKTVLANSGTAIMGAAQAQGEDRSTEAISAALDSPLLNDNHIRGAQNVLLLIVSGEEEITIDEIGEINDFIQREAGGDANIIMGIGEDASLGNEVAVTVVATGFNPEQQRQTIGRSPEKVVHTLEDDQAVSASVYNKPLQIEEEEDDQVVDQAIAEAEEAKKEREKASQPQLFDWEQEQDKEASAPSKTDAPLPREDQDVPPSNQSNKPHNPSEAPPEEDQKPETPAEHPIFEVGAPVSDTPMDDQVAEEPSAYSPDEEEATTSQPSQGQNQGEQETPREDTVKRFSLEDYENLREELEGSAPTAQKKGEEPVGRKEDPSTQLEIRKENQAQEQAEPSRRSAVDPTELPISESRQQRAEERRSRLRSFNHRFQTHRDQLAENEKEPAYKRQGIDLDASRPSQKNAHSRYEIDDSEEGPDIRSNNSFLHDNVD